MYVKLIIVLLAVCSGNTAYGSELRGTISTDPSNVAGPVAPPSPSASSSVPPVPAASSIIFEAKTPPAAPAPAVLGAASLPDGLYRASRGRIYVIKSGFKRIVRNLGELQRYAGQLISDRPDEELAHYPDRAYLDGDLVRVRGTARIYVIEGGQARPVRTLAELRRRWPGRSINNVESEELGVYLT